MQKLLIFILFLTCNILQGSNFMMNCVSSDFKEMAFYKFSKKTNSSESKLLSRPMKTKWQDFCCIPRGGLREGISAINKADIVLFTKVDERASENELKLKEMILPQTSSENDF